MTEPAGLERRYRRLLAAYPAAFRREQEDEMLAVLMAGARRGQRQPGILESADLIRSAVGMRLRLIGSGAQNRPWADALALFSLLAPAFLLLATILEVALPYRPLPGGVSPLVVVAGRHSQINGPHLLSFLGFDIALGCQAVIAALALLGLRWLALAAIAASAGCWIAQIYQVPHLLQLLSASVFLLAGAALIASPGPRRGRQLMTWRYGVVLLLVAAAVQLSTLGYDARLPVLRFLRLGSPDGSLYFACSAAFAAAAAVLAIRLRLNWYFLLFVLAMCYPYALQLVFPAHSSGEDLMGVPTPGHLALLFSAVAAGPRYHPSRRHATPLPSGAGARPRPAQPDLRG